MAHIVQFRSNIARTGPGGGAEALDGAQIIIFPGVRREYHAEMRGEPQAAEEERPKRDRLVLPD